MDPEEQEVLDGTRAHVTRQHINIKFQCGPAGEVGRNGCDIEDVVDVLIDRLDGFQRGPHACKENEGALGALDIAKRWLSVRTARRMMEGIEGTSEGN